MAARDDDDDDYEERPRRKPPRDEGAQRPKQRPAKPRRDDEDDDEHDDRPRRRPAPRAEDDEDRPSRRDRRPRDDDDDYDDDDRPRRRRSGAAAIIPYRNGLALASYYCSFGALIVILGSIAIAFVTAPNASRGLFLALNIGGGGILSLLSLVFGILGLVKVNRNPEARGTAHAIIGMVVGSLCGIGVAIAVIMMQSFFLV